MYWLLIWVLHINTGTITCTVGAIRNLKGQIKLLLF